MKPSPRYDFPIVVQPEAWALSGPDALLYDGIYSVLLNASVSIAFVPWIEPAEAGKSPVGARFDTQLARLECIQAAQYGVTPNAGCPGAEQLFHCPDGAGGTLTKAVPLFHVSDEEFQSFSEELEALSHETYSMTGKAPVSAFAHMSVVQMILERIIPSRLFSASHRELLGRGDTTAGHTQG